MHQFVFTYIKTNTAQINKQTRTHHSTSAYLHNEKKDTFTCICTHTLNHRRTNNIKMCSLTLTHYAIYFNVFTALGLYISHTKRSKLRLYAQMRANYLGSTLFQSIARYDTYYIIIITNKNKLMLCYILYYICILKGDLI